MNILLTGATGFTGHFFKQNAEAARHTVWPLVADLTDKAAVAAEVSMAQPTAVVHLAAISYVGHADEAAFYSVNVLGTLNLLSALASLPLAPSKVLLASSANVYGNCDASPITELALRSKLSAMARMVHPFSRLGVVSGSAEESPSLDRRI